MDVYTSACTFRKTYLLRVYYYIILKTEAKKDMINIACTFHSHIPTVHLGSCRFIFNKVESRV